MLLVCFLVKLLFIPFAWTEFISKHMSIVCSANFANDLFYGCFPRWLYFCMNYFRRKLRRWVFLPATISKWATTTAITITPSPPSSSAVKNESARNVNCQMCFHYLLLINNGRSRINGNCMTFSNSLWFLFIILCACVLVYIRTFVWI